MKPQKHQTETEKETQKETERRPKRYQNETEWEGHEKETNDDTERRPKGNHKETKRSPKQQIKGITHGQQKET